MKEKIVIAGGSGFFGNELANFFKKNFQVIILTRSASASKNGIQFQNWSKDNIKEWSPSLNNAKALINLSGKSINCRFTKKNKAALLHSRIATTELLSSAIKQVSIPPKLWINASAGALYIPKIQPNDESDTTFNNTSFLGKMALAWEKAFYEKELPQTRKVTLRISLILGKNGGVFPVLKQITKLGLGGQVGSGKQTISWIHIYDATQAVKFIIENESIENAVNLSTNYPCSNANFMKALRKSLRIRIGLPAPTFGVKIASFFLRKEPSLLLNSVNFIPKKLTEAGFTFKYNNIESALTQLND
ncbi:MAG: TIGR01777 family oxidoreductase [Vicingus serpentipes]|nr:TIGR01777 family oxidoreductase [Vicingus serpentipes]